MISNKIIKTVPMITPHLPSESKVLAMHKCG